MNRNFLKEAIADAKTVKESAIANAKIALEEAFTPRIQSMLSAKLEEMDNEEMDEAYDEVDEAKKSDDGKEEIKEKMSDPDMRHGESPEDPAEKETEKMRFKEEDDKELDEILAELDKELKEDARTDAEEEGYKDGIKDEKEDLKEDERTDAEEEGYLDGEEDEAEDEDNDEDEEIDLEDMSEDDLKKFIEDVIEDMVNAGEIEAGESFEDDVDVDVEDGEVEVEDDAETSVDVELDEDKKQGYDDRLDDAEGARHGKKKQDMAQRRADSSNMEKAKGKRKFAGDKEMDKVKEELREAYAAVKTLKTELNEINLLNAKLLYTNKIFKSKNLTETQKVKVLESFDKATTVKETKLVFETVNSGFKSTPNRRINENLGRASKAAGIAVKKTSKQPIVESDEMVKRFQKLAGIL